MSRNSDDGCFFWIAIFLLFAIGSLIKNNPIFILYIAIGIVIVYISYRIYHKISTNFQLKNALENEVASLKNKIVMLQTDQKQMEANYINKLNEKDKKLEEFLDKKFDNLFFDKISSIKTDFLLSEYKDTEDFLRTKIRPAFKKAEDIKVLRLKTKSISEEYNFLKYKYELLFTLFPELENYFDSLEDILKSSVEKLEDVKENYDYAKDYLSKDEYQKLTESQRNQLALTRYIEKRGKSDWQIGRDYELMVGQIFENKGLNVEYVGMQKKLNDLGRDLIAENENGIFVVQCKRWSETKLIREKHIAQLFGTTKMYEYENPEKKESKKIKAVFITTTDLSETAEEFAKNLDVAILKIKFQEFPRIKCNISSSGEKIYHLPFDQQYDRTKINKKGEFYASTVEEAEKMGFRRAMRFYNQ